MSRIICFCHGLRRNIVPARTPEVIGRDSQKRITLSDLFRYFASQGFLQRSIGKGFAAFFAAVFGPLFPNFSP